MAPAEPALPCTVAILVTAAVVPVRTEERVTAAAARAVAKRPRRAAVLMPAMAARSAPGLLTPLASVACSGQAVGPADLVLGAETPEGRGAGEVRVLDA